MTPLNPSDAAKLAAAEDPGLSRARASRARRRFHVALLALLILGAVFGLAAVNTIDNSNPQYLAAVLFVGVVILLVYQVKRLSRITRVSLPIRLLDERQRDERDNAHRFGHYLTGVALGASFILVAVITTFSPPSVVFPSWLAVPLLWLLAMLHSAGTVFYLAWTQPDELPEEDEPAQA
ncbi:hypothetical protein [Nocardiopsis nanhaiensis]